MIIRECGIDSAEILSQIGKETYDDAFSSMNTKETMRAYLDEAFDLHKIEGELETAQSRFFLLLEEEQPAAYFKINFPPAQTDINDPHSLELERIYVRQKYKGQGIGSVMIQRTEEIARKHGCKYVWLGVWEQNKKAISFYESRGYIQFKKHLFRMGDELQQDLLMKKVLD